MLLPISFTPHFFAASLAALRRSSLYGAVRQEINLTFCCVSAFDERWGIPYTSAIPRF